MAQTGFLGSGLDFPVRIGADGQFVRASDAKAIERAITLVLGTARGERLMRPDFGSDLSDFLFQPFNDVNRGRMATAVQNALIAWEPRIRVLAVRVTASPGDPATALIDIEYEIRSSNTRRNLVYPFYLDGGGP